MYRKLWENITNGKVYETTVFYIFKTGLGVFRAGIFSDKLQLRNQLYPLLLSPQPLRFLVEIRAEILASERDTEDYLTKL
jgi:hypothetical protein